MIDRLTSAVAGLENMPRRQKGLLSLEPCGDRRACPSFSGTSPPEPGQGGPLFGVFQREQTLVTPEQGQTCKMKHRAEIAILDGLSSKTLAVPRVIERG